MIRNPENYLGEVWGNERVMFWIRQYCWIDYPPHTELKRSYMLMLKGFVVGGSTYPIGHSFTIMADLLEQKNSYYKHLLTWLPVVDPPNRFVNYR